MICCLTSAWGAQVEWGKGKDNGNNLNAPRVLGSMAGVRKAIVL